MQKLNYNDIDKVEWDNFVESSSSGWFWHTSYFLDAWPYGENISFAIKNEKEILAVFTLYLNSYIQKKRKLFGLIKKNKKRSSLFSLGGIAVKDGIGKKQKNKIINLFKSTIDEIFLKYYCQNFEMVLASMPPALFPENNIRYNPLVFWGFKNTSEHTCIIDLPNTNEDDILKQCSETTRQEIKKIVNDSAYTYREAKPCIEDLDLYYKLHTETYTRTGVTPHPKSYFEHIFLNIMKQGYCRILFAYKDGKPVAAQNTLSYKGSSLYWTGASISEKDNGVNKYLTYLQIIHAKSIGNRYYEVGEIFPYEREGKLKGLTQMKSSFGGSVYPIYKGRYVL